MGRGGGGGGGGGGSSDVKSIFDMCQVEIVYLSSKYDLGNLFL